MDWIFHGGLIVKGYMGSDYTWMRGLTKSTFRSGRLDRVLANINLSGRFPNARDTHLPKSHSDHVPLLLLLDKSICQSQNASFQFQAA